MDAAALSPQPIPDLESRIVGLYSSGLSFEETRAESGCSVPMVRQALLNAGVLRRPGGNHIGIVANPPLTDGPDAGELPVLKGRWMTPDARRVAVEMYLSGGTVAEVADIFGVDTPAIRASVHAAGCDVRDQSDPSTHVRYHALDEEFFDVIDTEAKAYLLGFIGADGHVGKMGVDFTLALSDRSHLEKIRDTVGSDTEVETTHHPAHTTFGRDGRERQIPDSDCARLRLHSVTWVARLRELGLDRNKTLREKVCEVPAELARHYWRGFIDGDGTIGWAGQARSCYIKLVGSEAVCEGFADYIVRVARIPTQAVVAPSVNGSSLQRIAFGGNRLAPRIIHLLYHDSTLHLDRKKVLADRAIAEFEAKYGPMDAQSFGARADITYTGEG